MNTIILVSTTTQSLNNSASYIAGTVIALLILIYLIYSLIRPERF